LVVAEPDAPADVFGEGDVSGRVASGVVNSPTDRAPPQRLPSRAQEWASRAPCDVARTREWARPGLNPCRILIPHGHVFVVP